VSVLLENFFSRSKRVYATLSSNFWSTLLATVAYTASLPTYYSLGYLWAICPEPFKHLHVCSTMSSQVMDISLNSVIKIWQEGYWRSLAGVLVQVVHNFYVSCTESWSFWSYHKAGTYTRTVDTKFSTEGNCWFICGRKWMGGGLLTEHSHILKFNFNIISQIDSLNHCNRCDEIKYRSFCHECNASGIIV